MRALTARKHRIVVLAPRAQDRDEAGLVRSLGAEYTEVSTAEFGPNPARSILYAAALINALRNTQETFDFDLVHFASCSMNSTVYPFVRRLIHVPIVSDIHALGSARTMEPGLARSLVSWIAYSLYEKLTLEYSDAVLTTTDELTEILAGHYGHHEKFFTVPNCVTVNTHAQQDGPGPRSGCNDYYAIMFHTNFWHERAICDTKRLSTIVREVITRGYNVRLWIAGPGSERLNRLPGYCVNLGYVADPISYLSQSDLVILPIEDKTLGIHSRLVDAMAAGKPIVATREACCGLLPHIESSGIIVCSSLQEMTRSVCSLLEDPSRMKILGERNKSLANSLFSIETVGKALERAYGAAIDRAR